MNNNHPGAGIYGSGRTSDTGRHLLANNGLIVSGSDGLFLDCVSNSSQSGVGMITGPNGNTLYSDSGFPRAIYPFSRPGVLRIQTSSFTAADQGIYTCIIPDSNDNQFTINFGLYPNGFMGEL